MKPQHILLLAAVLLTSGCEKVLDKTDLSAFNEEQVFNDTLLARGYVDYVYDQNLPVWPTGDFQKATDEISGETRFFEGTVQVNTVADFGTSVNATNNYGKIRSINQFLAKMPASALSEGYKKQLMGQVTFFRAYRYFDLVQLYGGVPLVLEPLGAIGEEEKEQAAIPRSSTSESIQQIVTDLNFSIENLPGKWNDSNDWGRITSGAAAGFKGRILLHYASPQFNPTDLPERWQVAYDANKQAIELLKANGFGLHQSFKDLWFTETNNPEAVWVTSYNNKVGDQINKNQTWDNNTRPSYLGTGSGSNQPTWEMAQAFPMKNGKNIEEKGSGYDPKLFYKNRDPRFDNTIAYNGATWHINGNTNYRLWTYFVNNKTVEQKATVTGFYVRKAIDPNLPTGAVANSGTDWIEMRYAEVMLNLAEAACGINKLDEAYTQLKAIRQRAGIDPGADGFYGLSPKMTRAQMFQAILHERQIELAFEGKRFWDLRRWKQFETRLNGKRRTGVTINLKTSAISPEDFAARRDGMSLDSVYRNYMEIIPKDLDTKYTIKWLPEYYFFAIPSTALTNNARLEQNIGWPSGTFDPLK
ncbi:RagB/SusD family nutrient uptake outer membrane protein [Dyadobacter chenhuakuii]|uniref:RagB/SusD family nutrient uptake outer membrane protein n=1 Tax=Dyadobacter chenhuakuii TaxID=2909339 RepID=A0ABY4XNJ3_9BACT|nr:RagB/SusD family nutrient uptake outer membrane protein [Dyadobacter chenhuakuii]MCF2494716.1 RagB/SusD family nutrient uptake outer membrane protein [Dyadobacter chenhuakuii]USJ31963.1 RagB/SusD family nutrient uptake outer membrane protein [Dyadobacter chenhuakuii]